MRYGRIAFGEKTNMGKIENYINCLASIKMDKLDNQIIEFDDYCILRLKQNPSSWVYLSEPEMKKEYEREVERRADNQEIFQKEEDDCCYTIKEKMHFLAILFTFLCKTPLQMQQIVVK